MSILEYMLANQKQKEDLREGYVDVLKNSNTYKLGAGIGNLASDAATGIGNFASDITFNPLPYGEYARSAYDGMQNLYGNTLDRGLDNVIDYFSPNPIISGGPLSRGSRYMNDLTFVPGSDMNRMTNSYYNAENRRLMDENPYYTNGVFTGMEEVPLSDYPKVSNYDANMPGTMMVQDNFIPKSSDDRVYYQETDTGPEALMSGPLSDEAIRYYLNKMEPLSSKVNISLPETEIDSNNIDRSSRKNYGVFGDRVKGGR